MIGILRFIGLVNAAIWLGVSVGMFAVLPVFFSPEMKAVIVEPYNGFAAQLIVHRFFWVNCACASLAIAHGIAEFIYLGRPMDRVAMVALAAIVSLGTLEGVWLEPKLRALFLEKHRPNSPPALREQAAKMFAPLHGLSQGVNLLVLVGVGVYFWKAAKPPLSARYASLPKFGG